MHYLKRKYAALDAKTRQAFWLTLMLAVSMAVVAIYSFVNYAGEIASGGIGLVSRTSPLVVSLLALVGAILLFYGRKNLGGNIFLAGIIITILVVVMSISNLGFVFAVGAFVLVSYVASLVLPERAYSWSPLVGLAIAVVILLLDIYCPWQREEPAQPDIVIAYIASGAMLVIYFVFIFRSFGDLPLRSKLIITFLAAVILPVSVVGGMGNYETRLALTRDADRSLLSSASQVASNLDSYISDNLDSIRVEAQNDDFVDFLELPPAERFASPVSMKVQVLLSTLRTRNPAYINSYGILDRSGIAVADTNPLDVGLDKSDRDYFNQALRTGHPFVSPLFISKVTGEPVVFFSAPIFNSSGGIIGVLRARYNARLFQQMIARQSNIWNAQTFVILVDDHNIVMANSAEPETLFKSIAPLSSEQAASYISKGLLPALPTDQLVQEIPSLAGGVKNSLVQQNFTGDLHTANLSENQAGAQNHTDEGGAVRMTTQPWTVVAGEPQALLLAPVKEQGRISTASGIAASLLTVLLAVFVAELIARPVTSLTAVASRVAAGDRAARADARSKDEIGALAAAFNRMAGELNHLIGSLEQRVSDRTRALATSAEVSRRISTILDTNQLIIEVVTQLKAAFNYYHVHIYLFDDDRQHLVMAGGTGEAGRAMLARGHRIPKGKGLVGRAADTGSPVVVGDVSQAPAWLPNPLLPDTKSEIAVPILIGDTVAGVLDVQENRVGALTEEDADLLQSISNQVAIALQNARTYAQVQRKANREALISAIGQRIQHTTSAEDALKVAVREVGRALGKQNTTVRLNTKPGNGDSHG